jgi:hypothetical protein
MKNIICNTYFSCPIYTYKDTSWIKQLNKISDGYLKKSLLKTKKQPATHYCQMVKQTLIMLA